GAAVRDRSPFRSILPKRKGPLPGPSQPWSDRFSLDGLDVRGLRALVALNDFERHALTLGQRLVAVHHDRRDVDENVIVPVARDEAVPPLVREPLHGALSQTVLLAEKTTARAPSRRPLPEPGRSLAQFFADAIGTPRRNRAAVTVFWSTIAIVIGPTPPG